MNAVRRSWLSLVIVLGLLVTAAVPVLAQPRGADNTAPAAGKPGRENGIYIAQMIDAPVVAYTGTVPGLKATAPKKGEMLTLTALLLSNTATSSRASTRVHLTPLGRATRRSTTTSSPSTALLPSSTRPKQPSCARFRAWFP